MGAKYSPCMRKDATVERALEKSRLEEKETACCIRNDGSGCVQTNRHKCSVGLIRASLLLFKIVFFQILIQCLLFFIHRVCILFPTLSLPTYIFLMFQSLSFAIESEILPAWFFPWTMLIHFIVKRIQ